MSDPRSSFPIVPYPQTHPAEAADQSVRDLAGTPRARLTGPAEVARRLAALDERYIRENFVPLDELAGEEPGGVSRVRADIAAGRLPQPAYRLDDGTDMIPPDYFAPVVAAGSVEALHDWFLREFAAAAAHHGVADDAEEAWRGYLGGGYFVCLRHATPAAIVEKARHINEIGELLTDPRAADPVWGKQLRGAVDGLAAIERAFAILDPARWGTPMSGQWYGMFLRALFPSAFENSFDP